VNLDDLFARYDTNIKNRFKKYHAENPHVYETFKKLAFKMLGTGRKKYSARTIFEVMRWDRDVKTTGDVFKIGNDFIPIYVRLLIYHYPIEFSEFFELREKNE